MNAHVSWTKFSLLAIAALGAGALAAGCTVTTGTTDDSQGGGGTNLGDDDDTTTTGDDDTDAGDTDAGSAVSTCEGNTQDTIFIDSTCQACLDTSCCGQLKGCFNLDPGTDSEGQPNATCSEYGEYYAGCSDDCYAKHADDETAYNACIDEECRIVGTPAIADAWDAIITCAITNCSAQCAE